MGKRHCRKEITPWLLFGLISTERRNISTPQLLVSTCDRIDLKRLFRRQLLETEKEDVANPTKATRLLMAKRLTRLYEVSTSPKRLRVCSYVDKISVRASSQHT